MITKQDIIAQIDHFGKYEGEMKEHIDAALKPFSIPYVIYLAAKGALQEAEMHKSIEDMEGVMEQSRLMNDVFVIPSGSNPNTENGKHNNKS